MIRSSSSIHALLEKERNKTIDCLERVFFSIQDLQCILTPITVPCGSLNTAYSSVVRPEHNWWYQDSHLSHWTHPHSSVVIPGHIGKA